MCVPRLFSDMMLGFSLAVCAGLCASLASVSSKLAFEEGGSTISYFICTLLVEELCKPVNARVMIASYPDSSPFFCRGGAWVRG